MSKDKQRLIDYLQHIVEAIQRVGRYTDEMSETEYFENELVQDAVIRNFEVIGEACRNIDRFYPAFTALHPEVPFISAYEMRNALSHGYFKIDHEIVWRTIERDLSGLKSQVELLIRELKEG